MLVSIHKYWERWPPLHKLVATFTGYKQQKKTNEVPGEIEAFIAEAQLLNAGAQRG
jgi:hypothetical protein